MWFGSAANLSKTKISLANRSIRIGTVHVQPVTVVRDLGVMIDAELSMRVHVSRTAHASIMCVACGPSVGSSVVTSRHGSCQPSSCRDWITATPSLQAFRLRRWRRSRECCMPQLLVLNLRPRDHVSAALRELHWLPVAQRIDYKMCLLVHKSSPGQAPQYISNMLKAAADDPSLTTLRKAASGNYVVPRTNRRLGERAFSVAAPKAWDTTH